tara:strand:- start:370 stop:603 length:234 start_codon:yes stop_codon:yes gene_type:complete
MAELVDYILGSLLVMTVLNGAILIFSFSINSKISKQQRLIEFTYSRAMKAKKVEEHREKVEEEKLTKLRKARTGTKK